MSYLILEGDQLHQYKSTEQSPSQPQPIIQKEVTPDKQAVNSIIVLKKQ